MTGNIKPFNW